MNDKRKTNVFTKNSIKDAVLISLFAAVICGCTFVTVPFAVPFTLQTLGIFCTLLLLGGKRGTLCILLYVALGLIGLPVFSGFSGGVGHLLGATGGYIFGFILSAISYWGLTSLFGEKTPVKITSLFVGLIICYTTGTLWYAFVYGSGDFQSSLKSALTVCVLPFMVPDIIKLVLSLLICRKTENIKTF